MVEEAGKNDYIPVIYGDYVWEGRNTLAGVWRLTLDHSIVLTTGPEELQGFVIPAGSTIYLDLGLFGTSVWVPQIATCYPRDWEELESPVRLEVERVLENRRSDGWNPTDPELLPF